MMSDLAGLDKANDSQTSESLPFKASSEPEVTVMRDGNFGHSGERLSQRGRSLPVDNATRESVMPLKRAATLALNTTQKTLKKFDVIIAKAPCPFLS